MNREEAERELTTAGAASDAAFALMEGAFACAAHEAPGRGAEPARTLLDQAAARLKDRLSQARPDEAIARTMAGDFHLVGDSATYDRIDNADLISVCERRTGLPVALGIIYIDVARRCGLVVRGLDFPGHFLLRMETHEGPVVLDPFSAGEIVGPSELTRRAKATGMSPDLADEVEFLIKPTSDRKILTRLQYNILTRAHQTGDLAQAERAALRCAWLNPSDHGFWLHVAAAREAQGALAGALQALGRAERLDAEAARFAQAARQRLRSNLN
jgi:regulator of sirC expression with transglutaminase-like and TPR domain